MAGLLNNIASFVQAIKQPTQYFARQDLEDNASAARGLLNVYSRGMQDPQNGGGPQAGLLAQQGQLPPQFYQRLATIPGYEQFGLQDQQGAQAMGRQQQEQLWNRDNMSAYQSGNLALGRDELAQRAQLEQQRLAMLQGSMGGGGQPGPADPYAGLPKPQAGTYWGQRPDGSIAQIPVPGSDTAMERQKSVQVFQPALDVLRKQADFQSQYGYNETGGDAAKLDAQARLTIIPALTALYGSGKLDENEYKRYVEQVHQFNDPLGNLAKRHYTPAANMEALFNVLERGQHDAMSLQGIPAPDPNGETWASYVEQLDSQKRRGRPSGGQMGRQ